MDMNAFGRAGNSSTYQNVSLTSRTRVFWGTTNIAWDLDGGSKADGREVGCPPMSRKHSSPVSPFRYRLG